MPPEMSKVVQRGARPSEEAFFGFLQGDQTPPEGCATPQRDGFWFPPEGFKASRGKTSPWRPLIPLEAFFGGWPNDRVCILATIPCIPILERSPRGLKG